MTAYKMVARQHRAGHRTVERAVKKFAGS